MAEAREQHDEDKGLVNELLDVEEGLTSWEVNFAESLDQWMKTHETLTDPQRKKAEEILKDKG